LSGREKLTLLKAFEDDFKDPEKKKAFLKFIEDSLFKAKIKGNLIFFTSVFRTIYKILN